MAILDAVFANKSGQTPQDAERRRRMAQALIESGSGGKPPSSALELAGRLAMTLTGQYQAGKADRMDREGQARGNQALVDALYGPSSSAAPSQSNIPMTGAANEVNGTSPAPAASSSQPNSPAGFAATMLGKGEVPDHAALQDYLKTGGANLDPATTAWCAAYVNASLGHAGIKGTGSNLAKSFLNYGEAVDTPTKGDIAVFSRGDPNGPYGHVGFFDGTNEDGSIRVLGGNQGDQVSYSNYPTNRLLGYRRPPAAGAQVASLDPAAGMSSRQPVQGPTQPAPALPPPTTVANPPPVAAQPAQPPQQVAQALMAPPQPSAPAGVPREQIAKLLSDPYTAEAGQMLLMQEMKRRQGMQEAQYEQQLKQSDPAYQQSLQKGAIELENLQHPKMSPAEEATNAREQQKMAFEREKFDAEVKKGQWQKLTDGRLYNQTTGDFRDAPPPAPGSVTPKFDDISGIRKEIQQLPSYKNLAAAAPIYKAMAETAGRNSKASDLNLVYGLGKIMDPTSVVREGEMIMVKNTASLPDWLQGTIASLNGGAALTPETRQAIMTEAYGRVKGYNDEFQQNMGQYQGIVQRNGINPSDVIPEVDKFEPWKAEASQPGAPVQIQSVDDYNGLPKGTQYLDPNGKLRTKQ